MEHWVAELDQKIEGILLQRLTQIIQVWCSEFDRAEDGDGRREALAPRDLKRRGEKRLKDEKVRCTLFSVMLWCGILMHHQFLEGHMTLKPIVHEIRIQNQVIFLDPPIEYARKTWIQQLHEWLGKLRDCIDCSCFDVAPGIVCRLRRIQSSRYEIGLQMQRNTATETTYTSLVRTK